jgi:hypothetical protein
MRGAAVLVIAVNLALVTWPHCSEAFVPISFSQWAVRDELSDDQILCLENVAETSVDGGNPVNVINDEGATGWTTSHADINHYSSYEFLSNYFERSIRLPEGDSQGGAGDPREFILVILLHRASTFHRPWRH